MDSSCFPGERSWEILVWNGGDIMATDGARMHRNSAIPRRRHLLTSGLALRLLLALVVSWLVIMAFFVTSVVSR